ncbi:hypothetical protein BJ741DRAFT_685167, partial [Chytriomyces cf. hyalinus JEL632]
MGPSDGVQIWVLKCRLSRLKPLFQLHKLCTVCLTPSHPVTISSRGWHVGARRTWQMCQRPVIRNTTDLADLLITRDKQLQLSGLEVYDGSQQIDAINRISYPFEPGLVYPRVPIFLFFASEFQVLRESVLSQGTLRDLETKLGSGDITAVTPSRWSAKAINRKFGGTVGHRAFVIPHCVDVTKYLVLDAETRVQTCQILGIPDAAFAYLSVGAMTPNKNTVGLLGPFYNLALLRNDVYLILKGVGALHSCEQSINSVIENLV